MIAGQLFGLVILLGLCGSLTEGLPPRLSLPHGVSQYNSAVLSHYKDWQSMLLQAQHALQKYHSFTGQSAMAKMELKVAADVPTDLADKSRERFVAASRDSVQRAQYGKRHKSRNFEH